MKIISLKDYAAEKNVSYEAVRKQVRRYEAELEGHIIQDGRQQFLDEEAVAFLDGKRQKNPVVLIQQSKDEELEELRRQKEDLLVKVAAQADQIAALATWKAEQAVLVASAEQTKLALEASEKETKILEGYIADAKAEISMLQHEAIQEAQKAAQERAQLLEQAMVEREAREAAEARLEALKARSRWERLKDVFK